MKTILCFGDSNTWGYIPGSGKRYPFGKRWTGQLQNHLGGGFAVVEEGLDGRHVFLKIQDIFAPAKPADER